MDFTNKRVLVTGGTRGIGDAIVRGFLARGARVAVNGSSEASVAEAISRHEVHDRLYSAAGDLYRIEECRGVVSTAVEQLGGLDILVNNAGVMGGTTFEETTSEEWDRVINIDLKAPFFCTKFALDALRQSRGNVVNVASILGLGGRGTNMSLYCVAKAGVVNMTRDLAVALAPDHIRVNCVCPGLVETDMLKASGRKLGNGDLEKGYEIMTRDRPMKRPADPSEIANGVLYLASDMASFVTGAIHNIDGGVLAKVG